MTEEKYQKLNDFFHTIFLAIEDENIYFLMNMRKFIVASEQYNHFIKREFNKDAIATHLTAYDIYCSGKEIIENICPCYTEEYDTILDSGILDFSYEKEYDFSHFRYFVNSQLQEINVNLDFNYDDVVTLIHEFFHKTNWEKRNPLRFLLTEFVSIYFETQAIIYLMDEKKIEPELLSWDSRLKDTLKVTSRFNSYSFPFTMYLLFGEVNPSYLDKLCQALKPFYENKEQFEKECQFILNRLETIEKNYQKEIKPDPFEDYLVERFPIEVDYRYILGTLLAFYAIENCSVADMVRLNNQIRMYQPESSDYSTIEQDLDCLLSGIGIHIDRMDVLEKSLGSIERFIEKYNCYSKEKGR